jgi:hypothetical protein
VGVVPVAVAVVAAVAAGAVAADAAERATMNQTLVPFDLKLHAMEQSVRRHSTRFGGLGRTFLAAIMLASAFAPAVAQQISFPTPEAAAEAFGAAVQGSDENALQEMFGPDFRVLIPPIGEDVHRRFLEAWAKSHEVVTECDEAKIAVGADGWTLPIPLVKAAQGWQFDMEAGAEEMRVRRVGRNELAAMQVSLAYLDAQKEYASRNPTGDSVLQYAQKFESSPGKRDGLYWPTKEGEEPSPLGPLVAEARAEGARKGEGYHGYHYKILTGQGKDAPGGAFDYIVNGRMIGGFALVAWPVSYGDTGVMTFMVSHDGEIYEKNLGENTAEAVARIKEFNPGDGWRKVEDPS